MNAVAQPSLDPIPDLGEARLARQPIVDRHRNLVGFELFYAGADGSPPPPGTAARWTAHLVAELFAGLGVEAVLGNLAGFVNVDAEFLGSKLVEVLPPERIRLELGDSVGTVPETIRRCEALKRLGYSLVVDNYWGDRARIEAIIPYVDAVKVDLEWVGMQQLGTVARPFRGGRKILVAEKVESTEQYQFALSQGFDLFQGFHFARPERMAAKRATLDLAALLRLINLVVTDADLSVIENEFKKQPSMSVNLLRLANSVAAGARQPVSTIREALMRMGRRPLQTWLQLLVYTADGSSTASPLMHMAALRGKLMELVATTLRPSEPQLADRALMVGLLSLMHIVFGRTQAQLATELKLEDDLRAALETRSGPLGSILRLVESREAFAAGDTTPIVATPACDNITLNRLELEAFKWASEVTKG